MQELFSHGNYNLICVCLLLLQTNCCGVMWCYGVSTNKQGERNVSVHTNLLASFKVLVLFQGNCTLTKPVLFETLVIHLFAGAERVVIFFLLLFLLKSILCISGTMTKTKINCFHISGVGSQPLGHRNTHANTQAECLHTTHIFAHGTQCTRSKWICVDQNETGLIDSEALMLRCRHTPCRSSQLEPNISTS